MSRRIALAGGVHERVRRPGAVDHRFDDPHADPCECRSDDDRARAGAVVMLDHDRGANEHGRAHDRDQAQRS